MLTGLKAGRATLLLGADGKVAAWRVRVGTPPLKDDAAFLAAQKACPNLKATPLEEVKLAVTVQDEACRKALHALLQPRVSRLQSEQGVAARGEGGAARRR